MSQTRRLAALRLLALPLLLPACSEDVPLYCDPSRPCSDEHNVCLVPDYACVPAEARGELSGFQRTPPVPSLLTGTIKLARNAAGHLVYNLTHTASDAHAMVSAIHLHKGKLNDPPGTITINLSATSGAMQQLDTVADDQIAGILGGDYYLDVHTAEFTDGEARAQILPVGPLPPLDLQAVVTGRQETQPNPSPGLGTATVHLDGMGGLTYTANVKNIPGMVTLVHIHRGPFSGPLGPHVVDFAPADIQNGSGQKSPMNIYPQQQAVSEMLFRGGLTYFNVHTKDYPDGELRGQLLPAGPGGQRAQPFGVLLTPGAGGPAMLSAVAYFVLSDDQSKLSYRLDYANVPNVTGAALVNSANMQMLPLPAGHLMGVLAVPTGALNKNDLFMGNLSIQLTNKDSSQNLTGKLQIPTPPPS